MLRFKLVYSDRYALPLGRHVFPAEKYRKVQEQLLAQGVADRADFVEPLPASEADVLLVHSHFYLDKLMEGGLTAREELQLEIPYSRALVEGFLWHAGGSMLAAEYALKDGVAFNLGGGFHHAFPDHGEGFCMIHDVAIAIRKLQREGRIVRAMTIDCDVHQGNGTAAIFGVSASSREDKLPSVSAPSIPRPRTGVLAEGGHSDVFTVSLHQQNNYPLWKPPSSIDVNLPDGTGDSDYLAWLDNAMSSAFRQFTPDLICYIAGADPYMRDQLGGLSLTIDGLMQRDNLVFRAAAAQGIPVMVTYAGGYAQSVEDTVTIHCNTVRAAREVFAGPQMPAN